MKCVKQAIINAYHWAMSDTLVTAKEFDEKTHRTARGFTNFG